MQYCLSQPQSRSGHEGMRFDFFLRVQGSRFRVQILLFTTLGLGLFLGGLQISGLRIKKSRLPAGVLLCRTWVQGIGVACLSQKLAA